MTATPPSRNLLLPTPDSPAVSRAGRGRGTAGHELIHDWRQEWTGWPPRGGDVINDTARQVRAPRRRGLGTRPVPGFVHVVVSRGYDLDRGWHYLTTCERTLWAVRGAALSTFPVDCPDCRRKCKQTQLTHLEEES